MNREKKKQLIEMISKGQVLWDLADKCFNIAIINMLKDQQETMFKKIKEKWQQFPIE